MLRLKITNYLENFPKRITTIFFSLPILNIYAPYSLAQLLIHIQCSKIKFITISRKKTVRNAKRRSITSIFSSFLHCLLLPGNSVTYRNSNFKYAYKFLCGIIPNAINNKTKQQQKKNNSEYQEEKNMKSETIQKD